MSKTWRFCGFLASPITGRVWSRLAPALLAVVGSMLAAPAIPLPGDPPECAVPYKLIEEVALNRASSVWQNLNPGPVIPYQDVDGRTVAYMFHYRVDGQPFPSDLAQAAGENQEDVDRFEAALGKPGCERVTPPSGRFRYAHVLVSARSDLTPVVTWGEGLSEFFTTADRAEAEAARLLGASEPELKRIYFVWPTTWYEFEAGASTVVTHAHLLSECYPRGEFVARARAAEARARQETDSALVRQGRTWEEHVADSRCRAQQEWDAARRPCEPTDGQTFVNGYEKAPFYDWSYGCSPTAGAMVCGWLDAARGYGRLVDYLFQRRDTVEHDWDYNVPNCELELAVAMSTDTMSGITNGSHIGEGLDQVLNTDMNNYNFLIMELTDNTGIDNWGWDTIVSGIRGGYASVWSVAWPDFGHSMSVFGFDDATKDYWLHNTWDPPGQWWHYWHNPTTFGQADIVVPQSPAPGPNVHLVCPVGDTFYNHNGNGEVWRFWGREVVNWSCDNGPGDSARIMISFLGGVPRSWYRLGATTSQSDTFAVLDSNFLASDSARIQVLLYQHGADYALAAADGSHGNFRIVKEPPDAPQIVRPPNQAFLAPEDGRLPRPCLVVRGTRAMTYEFTLYNDSAGTFQAMESIPEYVSPVGLKVGSTGYWQSRAWNPAGPSQWVSASYKVVPERVAWWRSSVRTHVRYVKSGGGVAYLPSLTLPLEGDGVYLMTGNGTRDFQRYSVWNDTWCCACSLPAGLRNARVRKGAYLVADSNYVYAFKGGGKGEFYRYSPDLDAWSALPAPGFQKGMKNGFAVATQVDGAGYIYAGSGASNSEWLRFGTGTGTWETPAPASLPVARAKAGSSLTCDTSGRLYFLQGGGTENGFYSLDLHNLQAGWLKLASLPLVATTRKKKVKEGGCIEYFQGGIYAVKGGNTKEFWRFDPGADAWTYLLDIGDGLSQPPAKGILCARPLTAGPDGIYILMGNKSQDFLFYPGELDSMAPGCFRARAAPANSQASDDAGARDPYVSVSPNPLTSGATVNYSLARNGEFSLKLYDVTGKLVSTMASGYHPAGGYACRLAPAACRLSAGVYLLKFGTGSFHTTQKLIIE